MLEKNMILICPQCKKKHDIDERKIPANATVAKCKFCEHRFPIRAKSLEQVSGKQAADTKKTRRIGVSLSKGGVGKTTTSVNLAAGLACSGYKVLLVDTDTQGQDSFMLGVKPNAGLTELVMEELDPDEAMVQARENLWLLAGGKPLAGLKRLIDRKDFGGELTIAERLNQFDHRFDYVVVDTSPGWDPLTVNVLFYVNDLLTPVSLAAMSMQGLVEFLKSIAAIQKYRKDVDLNYILPTFLDMRVNRSMEILKKLENLYGERVCSPIHYNVRLSESPAHGQTIFEYAPGSNGAQGYRDLVRKVTGNDKLFR
jgi:chromosome partitioning protein